MNRNYIIKTISIPDTDNEGVLTGERIILEVVSIEKLKVTADNFTREELVFVCFEKKANEPKRLHVILMDDPRRQIEIINYQRNDRKNTQPRSGNRANSRNRKEGGDDYNPKQR